MSDRADIRATWGSVRWTVLDGGLLGMLLLVIAFLELSAHTVWLFTARAEPEFVTGARGLQVTAVIVAMFFYGWRRVTRTHPAVRVGYAGWLWLTPWSADRPLPLGPVHPALGDAITLAAAYGFCAVVGWPGPWAIANAYLAGQVLAALRVTSFAGAGWFAYGLLYAIPAAVYALMFVSTGAMFGVLAAAWAWGHWGLRVSLERFPWDEADRALEPAQRFARLASYAGHVGWPLDAIGPDGLLVDRPRYPIESTAGWYAVGLLRAMVVSMPVAAWVYVGLCFVAPSSWREGGGHMFTWFIAVGVMFFVAPIIARPGTGMHHSPISLLGRLTTGRLIIPRHDVAYLAPVMMVLATGLTPVLLGLASPATPPPARYALALIAAGLAWAIFRVDAERWLLTAPAHIFKPKPKKPKRPIDGDVDLDAVVSAIATSRPPGGVSARTRR